MKASISPMYIFLFTILFSCPLVSFSDEPVQIIWNIDNLEFIGSHPVTAVGDPQVIDTPKGKAVQFDGDGDGLFVNVHPLTGAEQFTLELIFRPDGDGPPTPRIFHLQEDGTPSRLMIEVRITKDNHWYIDTVIRSGEHGKALMYEQLTHPTDEWYNATLVFDGTEMSHYVNGMKEMSCKLPYFTPHKQGTTSMGCRINKVAWFKGAFLKARFTNSALPPEEFLKP